MSAFEFRIIMLFLAFSFLSCEDDYGLTTIGADGEEINSVFPKVEEALWPYFHSFEKQARKYGFEVDLVAEGIIGTIMPIEEANVAGTCSYGGYSSGEIVIDDSFWTRANYYSKEMIVFHELGHCFLFRDHLEGKRPNGSCISIMRSGLEECRDVYGASTKDYYIQELFSVNNRRN